jgi:hypothetical protein
LALLPIVAIGIFERNVFRSIRRRNWSGPTYAGRLRSHHCVVMRLV